MTTVSSSAGLEPAVRPRPPYSAGMWLFSRIPGDVAETLAPEQTDALARAAQEAGWGRHPLNIRMSIPMGARRYYLTLVGGQEKRSVERRSEDRQRYPLRTAANLAFFLALAIAVYMSGLFMLAVQASIVEF